MNTARTITSPDADDRDDAAGDRGLSRFLTPNRLANNAAPLALIVVWIAFFIATPNFLTGANISDLLVASSILVILTLGQQFAVVVAGIDLSVGANLPWAAAILGYVYTQTSSMPLAIVMAIAGAMLVGVINGIFVGYLGMTDFVVTLGSLSVVSGLTLLLTSGDTVSVSNGFMQSIALDGVGPIRWFWLIALVAALGCAVVLFRTRLGAHLLATGGNRDGARGSGVPVRRMQMYAYLISGLACGIAAVMYVARNGGANPTLQTDYLLSSIAAVVLGGSSLFGGRASIFGCVSGAILLSSLINGFTILGISQYYQPVAVGAVVLMSALLARFRS